MPKVLYKFWCLPGTIKKQLVESLFAVAFVRLALGVAGYKHLRGLIQPANNIPPPDYASTWGWCIERAAKFVPGASCLTQAVTLQYLLARRGYRSDIRIGVGTDPQGSFSAHAWLLSEEQVLIGGDPEKLKSFTPLIDLCPVPR